MNQKERMLAGLPYKAWMDGLTGERNQNKMRIYRYNQLSPAQREEQDSLTREILGELIDHIKVYEGGNISVKFKYADEFRRIAEYIELNSPMVTGAAG